MTKPASEILRCVPIELARIRRVLGASACLSSPALDAYQRIARLPACQRRAEWKKIERRFK